MMDPLASFLQAFEQHRATFAAQTGVFLSLAAEGVGLALILGVPLGVVLTRFRRLADPSISALALIQTIPSLALLGLLIPLLGIGRPPALTAAVLYSLLPIVMNAYVGIVQVPASVRDAARGMGMTSGQMLWRVELPLALPVILAGVRTGVVYALGVITVCALAGSGGLGEYITRGMARGDNGLVLLGALPILAITLAAFWIMGGIAWLARRRPSFGLAIAAAMTSALAGYALFQSIPSAAVEPKGGNRLVIGSKNFTESVILSEIVRQMLDAHTDLRIETRYWLGSNLAYRALLDGQIDLYAEYTGTLLTAADALDSAVPEGGADITQLVRRGMAERFDLVLLDAFGLNNTYAMSVTREIAQRFGLQRISDLRTATTLRAAFAPEFLDRADGWPNLAKHYNLQLSVEPRTMEPALMYIAVAEGQADLVSGFATDWQIQAHDLAVLEDDLHYFPAYHAAPLVRRDVLQQHPEVESVLKRLAGRIGDEDIRRMNGQAAQEKRSEAEVAREFLLSRGLLP